MAKPVLKHSLGALPPYLGGKRRLLRWIFGNLADIIPPIEWSQHSFTDAFLGGGAVSYYAKAQGFKEVIVNDISYRSRLIAEGLLCNSRITLNELDIMQALVYPLAKEGCWVQNQYCPSVFSSRHAQVLDQILGYANQANSPTKQALLKLLAWHLVSEFVCFGTTIGTSNRPYAEALEGIRDWQILNPKRFMDGSFPRLLKPTQEVIKTKLKAINRGVMGGSLVTAYQLDAFAFLEQNSSGGILFLDPPYPSTTSYEAVNRVLDTILTGQMPTMPSSPFSKGTEALERLLERAGGYPVWVLTYGNKVLPLNELKALVARHAPNRQIRAFSRQYRHLQHVSKNETNEELLIIAYKE